MWSETVCLRTRPASDQKIRLGLARCSFSVDLGLAGLVLCCETRSGYARHHKDTATFQFLFLVSLFCAWNITNVKTSSGVYLLKT